MARADGEAEPRSSANTCWRRPRPGAQVLQLFDSWVGQLSPADYREYVLPYSRRRIEIARQAGVPIIHFGTEHRRHAGADPRRPGGDVIGVDWRIDLDEAWRKLGPASPCRATWTRWRCLRPGPSCASGGRRPCSMRPRHAGGPATSSTWATASCRRRRRQRAPAGRLRTRVHQQVVQPRSRRRAGIHEHDAFRRAFRAGARADSRRRQQPGARVPRRRRHAALHRARRRAPTCGTWTATATSTTCCRGGR